MLMLKAAWCLLLLVLSHLLVQYHLVLVQLLLLLLVQLLLLLLVRLLLLLLVQLLLLLLVQLLLLLLPALEWLRPTLLLQKDPGRASAVAVQPRVLSQLH
jgi:hypothetical protein